MAMPIVSWWTFVNENDESQGITPLSQWNTGTIIAGETTAQKKIIVWNNKGGSTGVSSMKDCELGVVGQNGEIVGSKIAEKMGANRTSYWYNSFLELEEIL